MRNVTAHASPHYVLIIYQAVHDGLSRKKEGRTTIQELDTVVLSRDIEEHGLEKGDIGSAVHCYDDGDAFEVEFVTGEGRTVAVLMLRREEGRLMEGPEIWHARAIAG